MSTLYGTFIQTKLFRIKADVTKLKADILVNIPLLIGEGSDWEAAKISKFKVNSVEICVKPAYNFCTSSTPVLSKYLNVIIPAKLLGFILSYIASIPFPFADGTNISGPIE